ncbi:MAG: TRL-like family protein [Deltaproteobacteria bacterium]|nr:TRL-like family protein [Deltaproteobacteria bacterium]MBW2416285.1 TRL-like family protein [Deltaproteobacteria bacterium]
MKLRATVAGIVSVLFLTGCMTVYSPAIGILYTDVQGPIDAGTTVGKKEGVACAESILGLIARGDASIKAAAKDGGITKIASVDHRTENIIGVIGRFCTIVRGS